MLRIHKLLSLYKYYQTFSTPINAYTRSSWTMSACTNCFIRSVEDPTKIIPLPDSTLIALGRSEECGVTDKRVSRRQLLLKADYTNKEVKCATTGGNNSGCDGYALHVRKLYTFQEDCRLELLLGCYFYDLVFEPKAEDEVLQPAKRKKISESKNGSWDFIDGSFLVYTPPNFSFDGNDSKVRLAGFDLDGTLIKTKSGGRFPKDFHDWMLWSKEVKQKLKELHDEGHVLVIFSNQLRLSKKQQEIQYFKGKVEAIVTKLEVPILVHIATRRDINRKPVTGMWQHLSKNYPNIDMEHSTYVGDAAGRAKNWAPSKTKDHSLADRLFAINIGLKFLTPEEFFLGARKVSFTMPEFDPRNVEPYDEDIPLSLSEQEVIMMIGVQGSGKSHFCKSNILQHGYVYVNRDKLGTKEKCLKVMEEELKQKKSVVIDNTNPTVESRQAFLIMAEKYKVPVKAFYINVSVAQARHNNVFRNLTDKSHAHISDVLIHTYRKNFQLPTVAEGFSQVFEFKFNPRFDNDEHKKLYKMFLLES